MQFNLQHYKRMPLPEKIAYLRRLIADLNSRLAAARIGTDRRTRTLKNG